VLDNIFLSNVTIMTTLLLEDIAKQLDIFNVSELLPHEQTVPPNLKRLKEAMLNIGQLVDPIIVDKETKVVLDGNHRLKVLQIIECPLSVCQTVEYKDPKIVVGTWYLAVNKPIEDILKTNIKVEKIDCDEGKKALTNSKAPFMAVCKKDGNQNACFIEPGSYRLKELIEEQNYVLSSMKGDFDIRYIPDDQSEEYLSKGYSVFFRRAYTKDEIIKAAKDHNPFPPKSTRHIIPDRIIRLNMRLGWLHEEKSEALRHLNEMLANRVYNGNVRRYVEPVIVIY